MEKLPSKFRHILTQGKIVTGNSRAFIGTSDSVKEVQIGDRPVRYLTSSEYNALSDEEKMKEIAYMIPDLNQELEIYHYSNENLLDNWYFINPINQRAKTTYSNASSFSSASIDRWRLENSLTISLQDDGIQFVGTSDTAYGNLAQMLRDDFSHLGGKHIVFSVLGRGQFNLVIGFNDKFAATISENASSNSITMLSYTLPDNITHFAAYIQIKTTDTATICAAKLELGHTQTLAHKEGDTWVLNEIPDRVTEFQKCKNYLYVRKYSGYYPSSLTEDKDRRNSFGANATIDKSNGTASFHIEIPTPEYRILNGAWPSVSVTAGGQWTLSYSVKETEETMTSRSTNFNDIEIVSVEYVNTRLTTMTYKVTVRSSIFSTVPDNCSASLSVGGAAISGGPGVAWMTVIAACEL